MARQYELVVIGAGPAGESAAVLAALFGHRTAVIERNKPGGTVTTTGGAPTKTLREAALYVTGVRERDIYGVSMAAPPEVAMRIINERAQSVRSTIQQVVADNLEREGVDYIEGLARLRPNHRVEVVMPDGRTETLSADVILIATGSRPWHPPNIPFEDPDVCDSDQIFKLNRLPADICIIGGGAVGVEFATIYAALGVPALLSDMADRLLPTMDGELSHLMAEQLTSMGVRQVLGVGTSSIERRAGRLVVSFTDGTTHQSDAVLFAAGRQPNTAGLGLDDAAVEVDGRGRIVVDDEYRTSADGIFAAGDVVGPSLASIAMEQGRIAMFRAFGLPFRRAVHPIAVSAVYGMPEVARVGLSEEDCRRMGLGYEVGRCDLERTPRGAIAGHGGLLKLIFRRDDRTLLGVHIIGDIASELVGMGQAAMHSGESIDLFAALTLNTPSYTYAYKYAAFDGLLRLAASSGGPVAFATSVATVRTFS